MANKKAVAQKSTRVMTEEGRARIIAAQKKRWRKFRKEKRAAEKAAK
jgi:hypothetical protein